LSGLWEDNSGRTLAVRNDNSFFGGLMMSPRTKGFTLIFGNFEKDSLQPGKRGDKFAEHLLDLVTFEFAPNCEVKTGNIRASIKVDYRFGVDNAGITISTSFFFFLCV